MDKTNLSAYISPIISVIIYHNSNPFSQLYSCIEVKSALKKGHTVTAYNVATGVSDELYGKQYFIPV